MTAALRQIHAFMAWVFVVSIVIQVFLSGLAIPQLGGDGSFATHRDVGYGIGVAALALVVTAVLAKVGRRGISQSLGLLVLYVIQSVLPNLDPALPFAAALHPVNALVMFGLAVWYAREAWRSRAAGTVLA
jgi:hypothetical protein